MAKAALFCFCCVADHRGKNTLAQEANTSKADIHILRPMSAALVGSADIKKSGKWENVLGQRLDVWQTVNQTIRNYLPSTVSMALYRIHRMYVPPDCLTVRQKNTVAKWLHWRPRK